MQQVYAVISKTCYYALNMEVFHYPEDAVQAARKKAYAGSDASPSKDFREIYGDDASTLITTRHDMHFPGIIYAATWGSHHNIILVATFDVEGSMILPGDEP